MPCSPLHFRQNSDRIGRSRSVGRGCLLLQDGSRPSRRDIRGGGAFGSDRSLPLATTYPLAVKGEARTCPPTRRTVMVSPSGNVDERGVYQYKTTRRNAAATPAVSHLSHGRGWRVGSGSSRGSVRTDTSASHIGVLVIVFPERARRWFAGGGADRDLSETHEEIDRSID